MSRRLSIHLWIGVALGVATVFRTLHPVLAMAFSLCMALCSGHQRNAALVGMGALLIGMFAAAIQMPAGLDSPLEIKAVGFMERYSALNDEKFVFMVKDSESVHGKSEDRGLPRKFRCLVKMDQPPVIGAYYQITLTLSEAPFGRNPGMFDYRRFLLSRGIHYVGEINTLTLNHGRMDWFSMMREKIRRLIHSRLNRYLDEDALQLGSAMLLGDASQLDEERRTAFRETGTSHILAVSGLHFGILFAGLAGILDRLQMPYGLKKTLLMLLLGAFLFLVGFKSSALRAALMIVISVMLSKGGRAYDRLSALALAAAFLLILRPAFLYDVGYQLSMAAVLGLAVVHPVLQPPIKFAAPLTLVMEALMVSTSALISTSLLSAFHFNVLTLSSVIYNVPVVFLTGWILPLLLLTALLEPLPMLPYFTGRLTAFLMDLLDRVVGSSAFFGAEPVVAASPGKMAILFTCAAAALFILRKTWPRVYGLGRLRLLMLAVLIVLPTVMLPLDQWMTPYDEVRFFDVGQGDSALIRTREGETILVDTGDGRAFRETDLLLLKSGVSSLDLMVLTHPHQDHIGGAVSVLSRLKVGRVVVSGEANLKDYGALLEAAELHGTPVIPLWEGASIELEEGALKFLNPRKGTKNLNVNEVSLVMTYETGKVLFLFTGDISSRQECDIIERIPEARAILKVAHHGSKTSTDPRFATVLEPELAIISVGRNTFGHPNEKTLRTLEQVDAVIARTDLGGCVSVRTNGKRVWWSQQTIKR